MANPFENARNGLQTASALVDGGKLERQIAESRSELIAAYGVDPQSLAFLDGHTVHIDPSEAAAAWAYRLDWRPLPIFQPYAAWTEELDRRNAELVVSRDGPDRILRQDLNALGRYPAFESPAAMIEMLCRFRPLRTTGEWQVLGRAPNRCGEPRAIGSVDAAYGTPIPIPLGPAGSVVFGRARGVEVAGVERLRALLIRSRARHVRFEGDPTLYTFIPGTAASSLLLRAPERIDFPAPFALAPNADEVTFLFHGGAGDSIALDFYAMPVRAR